jgi:hypothetical protein
MEPNVISFELSCKSYRVHGFRPERFQFIRICQRHVLNGRTNHWKGWRSRVEYLTATRQNREAFQARHTEIGKLSPFLPTVRVAVSQQNDERQPK